MMVLRLDKKTVRPQQISAPYAVQTLNVQINTGFDSQLVAPGYFRN